MAWWEASRFVISLLALSALLVVGTLVASELLINVIHRLTTPAEPTPAMAVCPHGVRDVLTSGVCSPFALTGAATRVASDCAGGGDLCAASLAATQPTLPCFVRTQLIASSLREHHCAVHAAAPLIVSDSNSQAFLVHCEPIIPPEDWSPVYFLVLVCVGYVVLSVVVVHGPEIRATIGPHIARFKKWRSRPTQRNLDFHDKLQKSYPTMRSDYRV